MKGCIFKQLLTVIICIFSLDATETARKITILEIIYFVSLKSESIKLFEGS